MLASTAAVGALRRRLVVVVSRGLSEAMARLQLVVELIVEVDRVAAVTAVAIGIVARMSAAVGGVPGLVVRTMVVAVTHDQKSPGGRGNASFHAGDGTSSSARRHLSGKRKLSGVGLRA
jgi:hypothetical protein